MSARSRAALLAMAVAAGPAAARAQAVPFLGAIEVVTPPGLAPGAPLRATLELNPGAGGKAASLREWFPSVRAEEGRVTVDLDGPGPAAQGRPVPAQRGPTFLVDYDEPGAEAFRAALRDRLGAAPADAALARFVDGWIARKTLTRGIDGAARVAARREGDCTEHAVLVAAAARLAGRASRVVVGVALLPGDGTLQAFGHAWAEVHDGERWRAVDAAPLPEGVRYLPLAALADEGPGYLAGAWAALSPVDVRRIVLSKP